MASIIGLRNNERAQCIGIIYSSGDLGDVGRHAVEVALEMPPYVVASIKVFSVDSSYSLLVDSDWKCGCKNVHSFDSRPECLRRLQIVNVDCSKESLAQHFSDVDAIISCLGNRKPFHPDCIAKKGTERIVRAMLQQNVKRIVMLSSVGISNDWPPMEWTREGDRMQAFFRTICWCQYQDLTGAELAIEIGGSQNDQLDFLIVRSVILSESSRPKHSWYVQHEKYRDHPGKTMSKMDCARFIVEEAVWPSLHRSAVVVGSMPKNRTRAKATAATTTSQSSSNSSGSNFYRNDVCSQTTSE
jgi:NAD(P)H-binding